MNHWALEAIGWKSIKLLMANMEQELIAQKPKGTFSLYLPIRII